MTRVRADRHGLLMLIGTARQGGAEGQLVRLACELARRGESVSVYFTASGGPLTQELDAAGVPWEVLRNPHWPPTGTARNIAAMVRLAWRLGQRQPSVVFGWLAGVIWFAMPLAMLLTRAKRVAAFRGEVFDADLRWHASAFRFAVKRAHAVTINSPSLVSEALRWGADGERIVLIPNGVTLQPRATAVEQQPPTAVVVANFRSYKGHDVLLEALTKVTIPLRVRLVGEGDQRAPSELRCRELGLGHVEFVPHPADVAMELRQAQFAIHPSRTEGLSNAILEELAVGLPVVATAAGGTSMLVSDGVNGRLVPVGDAESLSEAITDVAGSPTKRVRMAEAARLRAEEFSWAACTDKHLELFTRLHGPRR